MKHIDFEFNGRTYALSFTAEALFQLYDHFGVCDDILETTHCLEPTAEGWRNCCWLAALMASQGELQRRAWGFDRQPMVSAEQLRTGFMAADSTRLRQAVRDALEQGFHRELPDPDQQDEVNLVLLEREEAQKKTQEALTFALGTLRSALESLASRPLTPSDSAQETPST